MDKMPVPPFFRDTVAYHVFRLAHIFKYRFRTQAHEKGFNRTHGSILMELARAPDGLTATALRKRMGVTAASMSNTLAVMERDGLIRRAPNPHDARSMLVFQTEKAAHWREHFPKVVRQIEQEALADFSDEETEQLVEFIKRICINLGEDEFEEFFEVVQEEKDIDC